MVLSARLTARSPLAPKPLGHNGAVGIQASSELDDLLPDRWLRSHPDCVWTIDAIRRAERCQKDQARHRRRGS